MERFYIRFTPENTWLAAFSLAKKGEGCRLDIGDTERATKALTFDLQGADCMAALLEHLGHTCQVTAVAG